MEYPFLHWTTWGGGLLIALVATIHVFIAHFAVGGGLFIAVMETRVQRLGLTSMKDYLRRYAKFFLHFRITSYNVCYTKLLRELPARRSELPFYKGGTARAKTS